MTVEELLRQRYKVIANYPFSDFDDNEIIYVDKDGISIAYGDIGRIGIKLSEYPHIFKPLEWWEERDEKDMPQYVKSLELPHEVFNIKKYYPTFFEAVNGSQIYWECPFTEVMPATKEEYKAQSGK